jgi:hypothetical protein
MPEEALGIMTVVLNYSTSVDAPTPICSRSWRLVRRATAQPRSSDGHPRRFSITMDSCAVGRSRLSYFGRHNPVVTKSVWLIYDA